MITAIIRKPSQPYGATIVVEFPCNDCYLANRLSEIGITDIHDNTSYILKADEEYKCLFYLNENTANVDQLNFLAKRLESFTNHEIAQFQSAVTAKQLTSLKDMINLTFNVHNFTTITDFSDLKEIGRSHYMDMNGGCISSEENKLDFALMGWNLICGEVGNITPFGVLYDNHLLMEEVYNGKTFPEYFYEECALSVTIEYTGLKETLYMPCEEISIKKALIRMDAPSSSDCQIVNIDSMSIPIRILDRLIQKENIDQLNEFAKEIVEFDSPDFEKLEAIVIYANANTVSELVGIAKYLDIFEFIPKVKDATEYGQYMIKDSGQFEYDENLWEYYDFKKYGLNRIEREKGEFNEFGYVCCTGNLDEILSRDITNNITMGGM